MPGPTPGTPAPGTRTPAARTRAARIPAARTRAARIPAARTPAARTGLRGPRRRGPRRRGPGLRGPRRRGPRLRGPRLRGPRLRGRRGRRGRNGAEYVRFDDPGSRQRTGPEHLTGAPAAGDGAAGGGSSRRLTWGKGEDDQHPHEHPAAQRAVPSARHRPASVRRPPATLAHQRYCQYRTRVTPTAHSPGSVVLAARGRAARARGGTNVRAGTAALRLPPAGPVVHG